MNSSRTTHAFRLHLLKVTLAALGSAPVLVALDAPVWADPGNDNRAPALGDCQMLQVSPGNKVSRHVFGVGVQIYRWSGTSWVFVAPEAVLYANAGDTGEVGHPLWRSHLAEQQRQQRGLQGDPTLHPGPHRHSLAVARGGKHRGAGYFRPG